jgi:hypothetical protein
MRPISNNDSAARGEVSLLAIFETCFAIALTLYLSAHLNTLRWLAIAVCSAPLLLLRTGRSMQLGVMLENHLRAAPEAAPTQGMQKAAGEKQKLGKQKAERGGRRTADYGTTDY